MADAHRPGLGIDFLNLAFRPVPRAGGSGLCTSIGRRCFAAMRGVAEAADRRFQVAFGVDQEVGGDHDGFAILHAVQHLDVVVAARPKFDLTRFITPFLGLNEDDLAGAAVDHGGDRHGDHGAFGANRQFHLREHARLEQCPRIGQLDSNRHRAGSRGQGRIDVSDGAFESLVGIGADFDLGLGTGLH